MNRLLTILILFFLAGYSILSAQSIKNVLPAYPIPQGVSAPFAGFIGDWLVVYGGCNFPDIPAAQGGTKVYYAEGYALNTAEADAQWMKLPDLPEPVAYGASASTGSKLYCLGGMNTSSQSSNVYEITLDTANHRFAVHRKPSLPVAIDNGSATTDGNYLYITGGNQENQGKAVYALSLTENGKWKKLTAYPGHQRVQPSLVTVKKHLFLTGGYQYDRENGCILSATMISYDLESQKWSEEISLPTCSNGTTKSLTGGSGTTIDRENILFTGGVNDSIFKAALENKVGKDYLSHAPQWYKFNNDLLIWNVKTRSWKIIPDIKGMEKAGGILLYHDQRLYMVCGETKPGIRTSEIVVYPIRFSNSYQQKQ